MKARQSQLGQFWIGAKGGLLEKKHIDAMGPAVWMFLYLLRGQTALNNAGEGVFQYGHPVTLAQISYDLNGTKVRTIRLWLARLKRAGYVRTEGHSQHGVTIWIAKGKSKTKAPRIYADKVTPRVRTDSAPKLPETSRLKKGTSQDTSRHDPAASDHTSRQNTDERLAENLPQFLDWKKIADKVLAPIPKGFIPESPSYYNTTANAKNASVVFPLSDLKKDKRHPQEQSPRLRKTKSRFWESPEQRADAYKLVTEEKAQREQERRYPGDSLRPTLPEVQALPLRRLPS